MLVHTLAGGPTVGAIVGFTLVAKGSAGVDWNSIIRIAISWVTSPLLGTPSSFKPGRLWSL
jgi:phosphate/sulfate permease